MINWFIGVDPGTKGGVACLSRDGLTLQVHKYTPDKEDELIAWLFDFRLAGAAACQEAVNGNPLMSGGDGFKFGDSNGIVRGVFKAYRMPWEKVPPKQWQAPLRLQTISADGPAHKNELKDKAMELFPKDKYGVTVTLWNADAILIADWFRKKTLGG